MADVSGGKFQRPVAAEIGRAREVGGGCHVGTRQRGEELGRQFARGAFGEVAAIDQDVGIFRQVATQSGQFIGVGAGHGLQVQHRRPQLQLAHGTVGNDVHRLHILHLAQDLGHLFHAVQ